MKTTIWDDRDVQGYWGAKRLHEIEREERRERAKQYAVAALVGVAIGLFICWRWL